jgi:histone H3/H4
MATETFIVKSKVADFIRSKDMMMSSDAYDALNNEVETVIKRAVDRCSQGGRKTVKPFDF